ncbi:XRE family transcriptional regulator [bacterium]|nr:XRE family transcriptional regulator [bacterium]
MSKKKSTSAALEYLHRRFSAGRPERIAELEEARASAEVARKVYELRTRAKLTQKELAASRCRAGRAAARRPRAKLTQKELAARVGTTASVISRLEDDDCEGHSLAMLRRIASALNKRVDIRFVALKSKGAA